MATKTYRRRSAKGRSERAAKLTASRQQKGNPMTSSLQRRTWTWRRDANGTVRARRTSTAPTLVMPAMPAQFQGSTARPTSATVLGYSQGSWVWEGMTR